MHDDGKSDAMTEVKHRCCNAFAKALEDYTDNEGYGPLIKFGGYSTYPERWQIGIYMGSDLPAMRFCPWCASPIREQAEDADAGITHLIPAEGSNSAPEAGVRAIEDSFWQLAKCLYVTMERLDPTEGPHCSPEEGWLLLREIDRVIYQTTVKRLLSQKAGLLRALLSS